ncbi:MAG TPA: hypothetical protein VFQ23_15155 [Anaerolineales bacterium]|nr:hypothetical protein [Anaerolineales bacterium]
MKKISVLLILGIFIVSACTFNVEVLTPEAVIPTPPSPTETLVPLPTPIATRTEPPFLSPTDAASLPQFSNTRFTLDVTTNLFQTVFPARIRRVYAVWDYQNMRPGLIVRRDWYFNNVLWITREEPWDFSKYGENGTVQDISVFDLDVGLASGEYRLELYIDMRSQPIGEGSWPLFTIAEADTESRVTSPDGRWVADVDNPRTLLVRDIGKSVRELYAGNEITNVTWLPDSQHILFVDRDRSLQVKGLDVGILDDLWIVDVASGESHLLYKNTNQLGKFSFSPDGRFAAGFDGSGFGDACLVDLRMIFFEFASDFRSVRTIKQDQFSGISAEPNIVIYPVEEGTWQNETKYLVSLNGTCNFDQNLVGKYVFDLLELNAKKWGNN